MISTRYGVVVHRLGAIPRLHAECGSALRESDPMFVPQNVVSYCWKTWFFVGN
jgi:hypothetical protein